MSQFRFFNLPLMFQASESMCERLTWTLTDLHLRPSASCRNPASILSRDAPLLPRPSTTVNHLSHSALAFCSLPSPKSMSPFQVRFIDSMRRLLSSVLSTLIQKRPSGLDPFSFLRLSVGLVVDYVRLPEF